MIKFLLKQSFRIISLLFLTGLALVVFVRQLCENEMCELLMNYFFWYSFGLFSGAFIARMVIANYNKTEDK